MQREGKKNIIISLNILIIVQEIGQDYICSQMINQMAIGDSHSKACVLVVHVQTGLFTHILYLNNLPVISAYNVKRLSATFIRENLLWILSKIPGEMWHNDLFFQSNLGYFQMKLILHNLCNFVGHSKSLFFIYSVVLPWSSMTS